MDSSKDQHCEQHFRYLTMPGDMGYPNLDPRGAGPPHPTSLKYTPWHAHESCCKGTECCCCCCLCCCC
jgi:hypothetical protein